MTDMEQRSAGSTGLLAVKRLASSPVRVLDVLGHQGMFYGRVIASVPATVRRYRKELLGLIAEMGMGVGALALVGGSAVIVGAITFFAGAVAAAQGFESSSNIGVGSLSPLLAAYFTARLSTPLLAGVALAVTIGAATTSQIGSMRISEEIDALEVMGIRSMPYLVATRVVAGFVAVVPLYVVGLLAAYLASRQTTVWFYGQSAGTYDHYFHLFLPPEDVLWSFVKVIGFSVVVILTHCYYGYTASGGPAGVGVAVGRAVRTSIVLVAVSDFLFSLAIWGSTTTVRIAG